jgi:hypothetical protein
LTSQAAALLLSREHDTPADIRQLLLWTKPDSADVPPALG